MEDNFFSFLDSSGLPIGHWLSIIIGGAIVISTIILAIIKVKKYYDKQIAEKIKKEQDDLAFKQSIENVATSVTEIQTQICTILDNQSKHQVELNSKINEIWDVVIESQKDSREGDKILENHIKNYDHAIDNINIKLNAMDEKSSLLIESDKEGIKSYITDKYYAAVDEGYIELHKLQSIELRYEKYLQENGNTYVGKLMKALREMPNEPLHAKVKNSDFENTTED